MVVVVVASSGPMSLEPDPRGNSLFRGLCLVSLFARTVSATLQFMVQRGLAQWQCGAIQCCNRGI